VAEHVRKAALIRDTPVGTLGSSAVISEASELFGALDTVSHRVSSASNRHGRKELDYRFIKELWAFAANRIAVRFAYEWHGDSDHWDRSYGNENCEFGEGVGSVARPSVHFVSRTSLQDGIYGLGVSLLVSEQGNSERYAGSQPSVGVYWRASRYLSMSAAYAHFYVGSFLMKASPRGKDVDYAAVWTNKF
jgi:hypothetical protein